MCFRSLFNHRNFLSFYFDYLKCLRFYQEFFNVLNVPLILMESSWCNQCGKNSLMKNHLILHQRKHTGEKLFQYGQETCYKTAVRYLKLYKKSLIYAIIIHLNYKTINVPLMLKGLSLYIKLNKIFLWTNQLVLTNYFGGYPYYSFLDLFTYLQNEKLNNQ